MEEQAEGAIGSSQGERKGTIGEGIGRDAERGESIEDNHSSLRRVNGKVEGREERMRSIKGGLEARSGKVNKASIVSKRKRGTGLEPREGGSRRGSARR